MANNPSFDFKGWATKSGVKCTDGRTIQPGAFKNNNGTTVPLVWQHFHDSPANILGNVLLEHRDGSTYAYATFNNTKSGQEAKALVEHGDIVAMSIFANKLIQNGSIVHDGVIREVSLVMSGANPGARIEQVSIQHADGGVIESAEDAIIYSDEEFETVYVQHTAQATQQMQTSTDPTVSDIFDSMTEEQQNVCYILVAEAVDEATNQQTVTHADVVSPDATVADIFNSMTEEQQNVCYILISQAVDAAANPNLTQSDEGDDSMTMKHNLFEGGQAQTSPKNLTREQWKVITDDALNLKSFKASFIAHAGEYGITDIDVFFPEAQMTTGTPDTISNNMAWVTRVLNGAKHTPFSRIKSAYVDTRGNAARARGYEKGGLKKDQVVAASKRVTTPTTIYQKNKLDRDDEVDITSFDVVAFIKAEMRVSLNEETARAALLSDGRVVDDDDKINEENIRPIYTDTDFFVHRVELDADSDTEDLVEASMRGQEVYEGSGNPVMFTTAKILNDMLLVKDTTQRRIYATKADLMAALMVTDIVIVPLMRDITRTVGTGIGAHEDELLAIIYDPSDYTFGADKGGEINLFDQFDIDYNQNKYLLETRMSGALTKYKSAIVIERKTA